MCFREQWSHLPQVKQVPIWHEDLIGVAKSKSACLCKMKRVKRLISLVWLE